MESSEFDYEEEVKRERKRYAHAVHIHYDQLPQAVNQSTHFDHFCFPLPEADVSIATPLDMLKELEWLPNSLNRAEEILRYFGEDDHLEGLVLRHLSSKQTEAVSRILAILVCAEESAVNIFVHEGNRLEEAKKAKARRAMMEVATEERMHDYLIQRVWKFFPQTDDLARIRSRTRRLFMRVASRELSTHFARISGLDSGVCISLTALLASPDVKACEGVQRLFSHVRLDESGHVKKARDHAKMLGFAPEGFGEAYELTRSGLVKMLMPVANAFEDLGVDADKLFKRLVQHRHKREAQNHDDHMAG